MCGMNEWMACDWMDKEKKTGPNFQYKAKRKQTHYIYYTYRKILEIVPEDITFLFMSFFFAFFVARIPNEQYFSFQVMRRWPVRYLGWTDCLRSIYDRSFSDQK